MKTWRLKYPRKPLYLPDNWELRLGPVEDGVEIRFTDVKVYHTTSEDQLPALSYAYRVDFSHGESVSDLAVRIQKRYRSLSGRRVYAGDLWQLSSELGMGYDHITFPLKGYTVFAKDHPEEFAAYNDIMEHHRNKLEDERLARLKARRAERSLLRKCQIQILLTWIQDQTRLANAQSARPNASA